jgi:hypothetical protein
VSLWQLLQTRQSNCSLILLLIPQVCVANFFTHLPLWFPPAVDLLIEIIGLHETETTGSIQMRVTLLWASDWQCVRIMCLIHNAHLWKILNFCQTLGLRITYLKEMFDCYFHLISTIVFLA